MTRLAIFRYCMCTFYHNHDVSYGFMSLQVN